MNTRETNRRRSRIDQGSIFWRLPLLSMWMAGIAVLAAGSAVTSSAASGDGDGASGQSGGRRGPAQSAIAINVSAPFWYDLAAVRTFTDTFKASAALTLSVPTDPLRSDFYPASLTGTATTYMLADVPGRYVGFCNGVGTFTVSVAGGVPVTVEGSGQDYRFEFDVPDQGPTVIIVTISRTSVADPLHAIRIVLPGFESTYQDQDLFHPDLLQALAPFSVLRFMNAMSTNESMQELWADRPLTTHQTQGGNPRFDRGMALEYMIDLANHTHAAPWFTLPHRAPTDYVLQFATMVHERLASDLDVYVEYSNETWNPLFSQHQYCKDEGHRAGFDGTSSVKAGNRWHAHKTRENYEIFRDVFGSDARRIICVNACQFGNFDPERLTWESIDQLPNLKCAVGPYFGTEQSKKSILTGGATSVLDATEFRLKNDVIPMMKTMASFAESHNHKLIAYEYNSNYAVSHYRENDDTIRAKLLSIFTDANNDPRMKGFLRDEWLPAFKAAGGEITAAFELSGLTDDFGDWGLFKSFDQVHTNRYDAIVEFALANPRWW